MLRNAMGCAWGIYGSAQIRVTKLYSPTLLALQGVGRCQLSRKKRYEGVRFNVISVTRGWAGVKFPGKKRYVTLEWPRTIEGVSRVTP